MRVDQLFDVQYAGSDDLHIAYQVVGDGPLDLLYVPGYISNIALAWEDRGYNRLLTQLSSFSRLILMDKRGTGLSDRGFRTQTIEDHVADIGAVLDAAGSERVAILGSYDGGAASLLYAAANPDRVTAVAVFGTRGRCLQAPDYPIGWPEELVDSWMEATERDWGQAAMSETIRPLWSPSRASDTLLIADLARLFRLSAGPGEALSVMRMYLAMDIRAVLQSVRAPVIVLNREHDQFNPVPHARYLADHLPQGALKVLPGDEFPIWWGDVDGLVHEVQRFFTGSAEVGEPERVLSTVLFTDFVGSTAQNASLGDRRWREILDRHDEHVRDAIQRFNGRLVKTTGDGILATFDGPARAIRCGHAIRQTLPALGLRVRAGIHTGEVELRDNDVAGIAVNLAARIMATADASQIVVSRTVKDLVAGSGIAFRDRGVHELKGIPEHWQLYEVDSV